jgi:hypothetical protein
MPAFPEHLIERRQIAEVDPVCTVDLAVLLRTGRKNAAP